MVLLKIAGMSWQGKSREAASRYASVKLKIRSELGAQNRKNNTEHSITYVSPGGTSPRRLTPASAPADAPHTTLNLMLGK